MATWHEHFTKLQSAPPTGGGNWITRPGDYLFRLDALVKVDGYRGKSVVANLVVLEASGQEPGIEPHVVGTAVSVVFALDKLVAALNNLRAFLESLCGEDIKNLPPNDFIEFCEYATGDDQPYSGHKIAGSTYRKNSAVKGTPLLLVRWSHVSQA